MDSASALSPASPALQAVTRYLTVGPRSYRHPTGRIVRAIYNAARAQAFVLDEATVAALQSGRLDAVDPADREQLAALGLLSEAGTDEAAEVIDAMRSAAEESAVRRFVIMPTAYCNMGCSYCGQEHSKRVTGSGHRDAIVRRFRAAAESGRHTGMSVRWFGGEPLMGFAVLRGLSREFTRIADEHGLGYTSLIVTNGTLLDPRKARALVQDCRVTSIEVTLDGAGEGHDESRPMKSGQASFARIAGAITDILADPDLPELRFSIRTNIGRHNGGQAREFAAAVAAAGLSHPRVVFYPAPLHNWGNDVSAAALGFREMAETEMDWLRAYAAAGLATSVLPNTVRRIVCTAVTRHSEVIAPDGRIYSCTEQPLVPGHEQRHVSDVELLGSAELRPDGMFDDWHDSLDAGETGCRDCRILPVCGGQCPKLWREGTPPCPTIKINLEDRLDLFATMSGLTRV